MSETTTLIVPSHPKYLCVIRSTLNPIVIEEGYSDRDAHRIVLAVDEACSNIIKYAYEGDPTKAITMNICVEQEKLTIRLIDTGKKPDVSKIVPRKLDDIRPGGLGTHFMAAVFDNVDYDTSGETGTVLTLIKVKR
jgi:anti-sigma regulatory factor (Ser/Thr protein kinase)